MVVKVGGDVAPDGETRKMRLYCCQTKSDNVKLLFDSFVSFIVCV